ncbi:GAF domain-containing protein [Amycolatopsis sp. NPDC005232]|uniref:helix-turn-helix domain-containing protein n=1 Tax=Amycolatopsis sp. NPDC005232 TaxID=3157027 RepID=UPI00339EEDEF
MRTHTSHDVRRWLAGVGSIAAAVNATTPLPELLDLIARTACELTGYDASGVLLADDAHRTLRISGSSGLSADYVVDVNERRTITLADGPLSGGPSSRAFRTARPVPIEDILSDPSFEPWAGLARDYGYRAIAAVPLLIAGEPVGTLNCYERDVHEFGEDELTLLATLANQAATALQSARMITSLTAQRKLLEQAEEIHRELTAVALRAGGVQGVAEALARLLGSPVLVTDAAGTVFANAPHRGVQLSAGAQIPAGLHDDDIDEDAETGRVTAPVLLGRDVVARLWLSGSAAALTELDRRAIEHAALVCSLEFVRRRTAEDVEWSMRADLLADVLAGASADALSARAIPLGHDLSRAHTVLVAAVDGSPADQANRTLVSVLHALADRLEPRPLVTAPGGHVVLLWPDTATGEDVTTFAELVRTGTRRALEGATVTVVIGRRCARIDETPAAVGTARGAMELARLRGADRTITLPDLGVYGLLLQLNDPTELVRFATQVLAPLREYDQRKNTQLVDTVRSYLDHGMNVTRTATALFVHPNTIGLRLKKVEELAGVALQQPESLLRLKVALMADDVFGTDGPGGQPAPDRQGRPNIATRSTRSSNSTRRSSRPGSRSE